MPLARLYGTQLFSANGSLMCATLPNVSKIPQAIRRTSVRHVATTLGCHGRQDLVWTSPPLPPRTPKQLPCNLCATHPQRWPGQNRRDGPTSYRIETWVLIMTGHCLRLSIIKSWCTYARRSAVRSGSLTGEAPS